MKTETAARAVRVQRIVGRALVVAGTKWAWRIGRGGGVTARSENGDSRFAQAWTILGITPDLWERGQWKKTTDGRITPKHVAKWLLTPNAQVKRRGEAASA